MRLTGLSCEEEGGSDMKKKGIIAVVVVVIAVAVGVYLLARPKPLGSMHNSYSEQTTAVSDISFLSLLPIYYSSFANGYIRSYIYYICFS